MDTAAASSGPVPVRSSQTATQAYAIPINDALSIAKQIEARQRVLHRAHRRHRLPRPGDSAALGQQLGRLGRLGRVGRASADSAADGSGSKAARAAGRHRGVTIAGTVSGSPAANAWPGQGDTITAVGGQSVSSAEDIAQGLVKYHPGD